MHELLVNHTVDIALHVLALLQLLGGVVLQHVVGNVRHAVLRKLLTHSRFSHSLQVGLVDLDSLGSHQLLLDEVPLQLADTALEVLLDEVLTLVLVIQQHDALKQSLGERQLANLLLHIGANVLHKLIVAVHGQLRLQHLADLLTELLLAAHNTLAKHAVEQLLVHLSWLEVADARHLIAEVRCQVLHGVLINLQQGSHLSIAAGISLLRVERDDVAGLAAVEQFLLSLILDIGGHDHTAVRRDTALERVALLVELAQVARQCVVAAEHVGVTHLTVLAGIHLYLIVNQLVVGLDSVVVELVLAVEHSRELGSHGDVVSKGEGTVGGQVLRLLALAGQGLAQHLYFVLADVLRHFFVQQAVDLVDLCGHAILLLDHTHGHHAGAETGHLCAFPVVFQGLFDLLLIVFFLDGDGQKAIHLVGVFKRNVHCLLYLIYILYSQIGVQNYANLRERPNNLLFICVFGMIALIQRLPKKDRFLFFIFLHCRVHWKDTAAVMQ